MSFKVTFGLLAGLCLLLSACGSADSQSPAADAGKTSLSFSASVLLGEDTFETHIFREELIEACMRQQGFEYQQAIFQEPEQSLFDSEELRRDRGFGYSIGEVGVVFEEEISDDDTSLSDEGTAQREQCSASAWESLNERTSSFIEGLAAADREVFDSIAGFEHPEMLRAEGAWLDCMEVQGYSYRSVSDMYEYALSSFTSPDSLNEEIQLAVADWDCSHSDGVSDVIDQVYLELDERLSSSWETALS